ASARDEAQASAAAMKAQLASLESEAAALARSLAKRDGREVKAIDQVTAAPGYERALAAALGDDLEAPVGGSGPLRWAGTAAAGDAALPGGVDVLAEHVAAPAALARRPAPVVVVGGGGGA